MAHQPENNGKTPQGFLKINVASPAEGHAYRSVKMRMTFINAQTGKPLELARTQFTFFDFDKSKGRPNRRVTECLQVYSLDNLIDLSICLLYTSPSPRDS